jgi:hypothetical protein
LTATRDPDSCARRSSSRACRSKFRCGGNVALRYRYGRCSSCQRFVTRRALRRHSSAATARSASVMIAGRRHRLPEAAHENAQHHRQLSVGSITVHKTPN